jgi:hypothetical protein
VSSKYSRITSAKARSFGAGMQRSVLYGKHDSAAGCQGFALRVALGNLETRNQGQ